MIEKLRLVEIRCYVRAIAYFDGSAKDAAKALGVSLATFYRHCKRHGINPSERCEATPASVLHDEMKETTMSDNRMNIDQPGSRYDLTQDGDRRRIDVGSADWDALQAEIKNAPIPLAKAAEIAKAAGVAAEHQAWVTEMSIKGLELLIKGAKKAVSG